MSGVMAAAIAFAAFCADAAAAEVRVLSAGVVEPEAAVMTAASSADAARAVMKAMATPAAKTAFVAAGVE